MPETEERAPSKSLKFATSTPKAASCDFISWPALSSPARPQKKTSAPRRAAAAAALAAMPPPPSRRSVARVLPPPCGSVSTCQVKS